MPKILIDEATVKLALEALEDSPMSRKNKDAIDALREVLAQPAQQEPVAKGKLKVTLQDTPTEIELAQYKRMFAAACAVLGEINEALGLDPDDGGAEPILSAIAELKLCQTCEALARTVMLDQTSHDTSSPAQPAPEYCDPSSSIYGLAEMVVSDCGHSSNNQRLLDKIAARIQSHIDAAAPQPAQQTCNCRWEGDVQVQQCTLHAAHVDAIHEWAGRAKAAEAKLKENT